MSLISVRDLTKTYQVGEVSVQALRHVDVDINAGEFVWRECGSRHVAWTPEGGLMLAMFQIPNKFYERDGRVTDVSGQDWEDVWGRALKG